MRVCLCDATKGMKKNYHIALVNMFCITDDRPLVSGPEPVCILCCCAVYVSLPLTLLVHSNLTQLAW